MTLSKKVPEGFSIRQLNDLRWYVVRHGRNDTRYLRCENGGYRTYGSALLALQRELQEREKDDGKVHKPT